MKKFSLLLLLVVGLSSGLVLGQENQKVNSKIYKKYLNLNRKGAMFAFWGWNREVYTPSNIHFTGADYDFTLHSVVAHDRQSPISFYNYLHPLRVTIPQTNFRVGYFIKDNLAIVFGVDHMKYVMDQTQVGRFSGHISDPKYASMVHGSRIDLTDAQFLTFEHTDGLNYANFGVEAYKTIYNNHWFDLNWAYGAGLGVMIPKSNVKLFGNKRSDRFHIAGFAFDARTNLNLVFWKHIMLRAELKPGFIYMPDIMTTLHNKPDKASQQFAFIELNFGIGYAFQTIRPDKKQKSKK